MPERSEEQITYTVDHLPLFQEARRRWHGVQQSNQVDHIREIDSIDNHSDNRSELSEEYSFGD